MECNKHKIIILFTRLHIEEESYALTCLGYCPSNRREGLQRCEETERDSKHQFVYLVLKSDFNTRVFFAKDSECWKSLYHLRHSTSMKYYGWYKPET